MATGMLSAPQTLERKMTTEKTLGQILQEMLNKNGDYCISDFDCEGIAQDLIKEHEARKWQPIETAPKDGTKIIGIDGTIIYTYRFLNGGWSIELRSAFLNTSAPDFWQPLKGD